MKAHNAVFHSESGYIIITVAVLLAVLLGFSALAVDSGILYSSRTSAQRIADSAALSGVATFVFDPTAPQPATAEAHARAFAESKEILGDSVQPGEVDVTVDVPNRRVTVDILRNEETYLAKSIGFTNADVGVTATAEAGAAIAGSDCVKPWFLPNSIFVQPVAGDSTQDTMCDACNPASPLHSQLLFDPNTVVNGVPQPTAHAKAMIAAKTRFTIKPNNPKNALEPAQFYAMTLGNGRGASTYKSNITTCANVGVACGQCHESEPGNMVGPTDDATSALIGSPLHDTLISASPVEIDSGGVIVTQSPSRVIVPIWDICSDINGTGCQATGFCPGEKLTAGGRNVTLKIIGYADVFIADSDRKDGVDGYLLGLSACKTGGGGAILPTPVDGSSVLGFPIRLVRPSSP